MDNKRTMEKSKFTRIYALVVDTLDVWAIDVEWSSVCKEISVHVLRILISFKVQRLSGVIFEKI